jgi:peptidoglycan biosynthesis protein MviN/MurJ (putative lipid II flippase)
MFRQRALPQDGIGLFGKILAPSFYSLKDTKTPVIVAIFIILSYISF